jgi:hypothetical protein
VAISFRANSALKLPAGPEDSPRISGKGFPFRLGIDILTRTHKLYGYGNGPSARLSDAGFLKKLRAIVKDSDRVVLTKHAKQRMRQRRINQRQIMECLRKGRICEPAHLTIHGDWMATLDHQYAGDTVRVVVAIELQEDGELAVVVTVMN